MIAAFCIVSGILFLFLFVVWSRNSMLNLFIKCCLGAMMIWAIVCGLVQAGLLHP